MAARDPQLSRDDRATDAACIQGIDRACQDLTLALRRAADRGILVDINTLDFQEIGVAVPVTRVTVGRAWREAEVSAIPTPPQPEASLGGASELDPRNDP